MASVLKSCLIAASIACVAGLAVAAESTPGKTQMCVRGSRIDSSPAVDRYTIVLKMKDGSYKRVDLANSCSSLMFGHGFIYETSTDELCTSTPLRINDVAGGTCMIKQIVDIDKDEAKRLLSKDHKLERSIEQKSDHKG
jgi:hypothetical protein